MLTRKVIPESQLIPAPYNPRLPLLPGSNGYEKLKRSLAEFDLVQPIVWNEQTGHVVAGHQRLQVLRDQGVTEFEVVVVSLSLDREKALNVTLKNREVGSDWDATKLVHLLNELVELPDFDATLTGFDQSDLNDLLLTPDPAFTPQLPDNGDARPPVVQVQLEIPPDQWDEFRPDLDALIAEWEINVHVRTPAARE